MLLCFFFISNLDISEDDTEEVNFTSTLFHKVNILSKQKEIFIIFLAIVTDMVASTFFYPIFTLHLLGKFGLSIETSSVFFVISMVSYFIILQFLNEITNKFGSRNTIIIGLLLNAFAVLLLGPVKPFFQ
jgi:fucose permease